jgi:hypothetical protein
VKVIIEEGVQNAWTESEHLARPLDKLILLATAGLRVYDIIDSD